MVYRGDREKLIMSLKTFKKQMFTDQLNESIEKYRDYLKEKNMQDQSPIFYTSP